MEIKLITQKEMNKLLKLKVNKSFEENFHLLKVGCMTHETTFAMLDKNEILGAFSYSEVFRINQVEINGVNYAQTKPVKLLAFIEVKPSVRKMGVGKKLLNYAFEVFSSMDCAMMISNVVMDGQLLVPTYKELSEKHRVNLLFSPQDKHFGSQLFDSSPVENPNVFRRWFKFK